MSAKKSINKRLGERLVVRLKEFNRVLKSGEPLDKVFTARTIQLNLEPKSYSQSDIRELRELLGVSQAVFAKLLCASKATIESWEQGVREPHPMARRLLDEIARNREYWVKLLREHTNHGALAL